MQIFADSAEQRKMASNASRQICYDHNSLLLNLIAPFGLTLKKDISDTDLLPSGIGFAVSLRGRVLCVHTQALFHL